MVWSYHPTPILFCLSKESVHESKRSFHWFSHKTPQESATDELLGAELWRNWRSSKSSDYDFIFPFCLTASTRLGSIYWTSFHLVGQKILWTMWYRYMVPAGHRPKIWLCASILGCGKILHHESFKTSRRSFIKWLLTNKFLENRQFQMSEY